MRPLVAPLLAASLVASAVEAQAPTRTPTPRPKDAAASVSVGYVLVPFTLTDLKGRPVLDLKAKDVDLLVDGAPVALDLFERSDDAPVSFTILLDGSGSMGLVGKLEGARTAIRTLLDMRHPGDDFALHVFARGEVKEVVPFTADADAVWRAIEAVKPFGMTAFYDALAKMPDRSLLGRNGSRAILLLTDGLDNASTLTRDDLARILEGIDVPVYPLGLRSPGATTDMAPGQSAETLLNLEILAHLARISGGRLAVHSEPGKLKEAIEAIEHDLRTQYLLGFTPTGRGDVRYRHFSLRFRDPGRPVRVRAGYRGTEPPWRDAPAQPESPKPKKRSRR